jgi:DNA-binding response OmpR family regulator
MKLLVVEDEVVASRFLCKGLREEGYAVDLAENSWEADAWIAIAEYDAIVLDVLIPGKHGFELCASWRKLGVRTPVIFLTALDAVDDRIKGLDTGGDDFLSKPYSFDELLARLRAILRRAAGAAPESILVFGDLTIDLVKHSVFNDGEEVNLTAREFQMLEHFALNAGKLITRMNLWEHVWETGSEPDSNVVDVYIRYLRDKLGRSPDYIRTVRGSGYVFAGGRRNEFKP